MKTNFPLGDALVCASHMLEAKNEHSHNIKPAYMYIVNNIAHQGESLFRQTKRCYHHYYPSSNCVYDVILSTWIAETLAGIAQTDRQTDSRQQLITKNGMELYERESE